MSCLSRVCTAGFLLVFCAGAQASWQTSNAQGLYGDGYAGNGGARHILTLEHARGNQWGDLFAFVDVVQPRRGDRGGYGELWLRAKLGSPHPQWLRSVLWTVNVERPQHGKARWLFGPALDFSVPGFRFFKTHWLRRDNPTLPGVTWQFTLVWQRPFAVAGQSWLFEGFADLAGSEGPTVPHQLLVPRLLMDVGQHLGRPATRWWLGVEWTYWRNRFGVDGVTESVPQLQLKWQFD